MSFFSFPDVREHIVESNAEGDNEEDVGEEGKWDEVFELADLAGENEGNEDKEHIPEDVELVVWKVVVH